MANGKPNYPSQGEISRLYNLCDSRDFIGAETFCRKLLANFPAAAEVSKILGVALGAQGKTQDALKVFSETIRTNPDYPDVYLDFGLLLHSLGRREEAIENFRKAVELDPEWGDAQNNLGVMLQNQNQHEQALPHLEKAITLNPNNPASYFNCANSLKALGKNQDALKNYNQAVNLHPSFPDAFNNRGNLLESMEKLEDAQRSFSRAIELDRNFARAYSNRGNVERKLGNHSNALRDFSKALELEPWQPDNPNQDRNFQFRMYINLGDIYLFSKKFDKALEAYDRAQEIEPDNQDVLGFKSNAVAGLGKLEESLQLRQQSYGMVSFNLTKGVSIVQR